MSTHYFICQCFVTFFLKFTVQVLYILLYVRANKKKKRREEHPRRIPKVMSKKIATLKVEILKIKFKIDFCKHDENILRNFTHNYEIKNLILIGRIISLKLFMTTFALKLVIEVDF